MESLFPFGERDAKAIDEIIQTTQRRDECRAAACEKTATRFAERNPAPFEVSNDQSQGLLARSALPRRTFEEGVVNPLHQHRDNTYDREEEHFRAKNRPYHRRILKALQVLRVLQKIDKNDYVHGREGNRNNQT